MFPNNNGAHPIQIVQQVKTDITPRGVESRASSTSRSFRRRESSTIAMTLNQQQKVFIQMTKQRMTQSSSVGAISDRGSHHGKVQAITPKPSLQPAGGKKSVMPQKKQLTPILDPNGPNLQSEYASMGRPQDICFVQVSSDTDAKDGQQNQARFLYDSTKQGSNFGATKPEHRQSVNSKVSNETSDDCNQVAEEDQQISYIRVRNAYLNDDIITQQDNFKHEPKPGKRPNPNPNINMIPHSALNLNHHPLQSPIMTTNNPAIQPKTKTSNRRIFDTGSNHGSALRTEQQQRPVTQASHALMQALQQRKPSGPFNQNEPHQQQIANKNGRRIVTQQSKHAEVPPGDRFRASTQIVVLPAQPKNAKLEEKDNSSSAKAHPMFQRMLIEEPNSSKKQAMIHQFEMSCGTKNGLAAQVYNNRDIGQSGSMQGLMNKATLCDSTASLKQNNTTGSNSQFLRKSLWLLTNSKSRSLRDLVQQKQSNCNLCQYIHSYQQLTVAANFAYQSSSKAVHTQSIFQIQNAKSPQADRYWSKQSAPQEKQTLQYIVPNHMGSIEKQQKQGQAIRLLGADGSKSKSLQFQNLPAELSNNLGSIQTHSRINLKINSPKSPQSPGTPNSQKPESFLSGRRSVRRINNAQGSGSLLSADQQYDVTGVLAQHLSSVHHELFDRFEAQYFYYLLKRSLNTKYMTSQEYYNSKVSSDIMYNEQRHIVSVFKEYLIYDDFSEYLKRFYTKKESVDRLPRIFEFYENYSKVFPNYVSLPESKYMFKNIERKQKLIDQRHQNFLRNQKKDKGELNESRSSMLVLFNSKFLKEVYDEPYLHDSLMQDPRTELSNQMSSRVLNNPPKMQESQSILNTPQHNRELEHIIHLLSRFEQDSIMAREVVSDSLMKGQDGPPVAKGIRQQIKLEMLFSDPSRIQQVGADWSMDSWAINPNHNLDSQFTLKQDSELDLASEILAQSCDLADGQISRRITNGVPTTQFTIQKPSLEADVARQRAEAKAFEFANSNNIPVNGKDVVREFLDEPIDEPITVALQNPSKNSVQKDLFQTKKSLQHTQSLRGIFTKKFSIGETDKAQRELLTVGNEMTRNQEFIPRNLATSQTQHPTQISSGSSLNGPLSRPGATSAARVRETLTQKGMPKHQVSHGKLHHEELKETGTRFQTLQAESKFRQSPGGDSIQQNIKSLIKETNKIINNNNTKPRNFEQVTNDKLRLSQGERKSTVQTISRNDRSSSIDKKRSLPLAKKPQGMRIEQINSLKTEQELISGERLISYGSQASFTNSQNPAKFKVNQQSNKQKKMLDEKTVMKRSIKIHDNEDLRSKYATANERKVKTVLEIRDDLDRLKTKVFNKKDSEPKPLMKIEPPPLGTTKITKSSLGSTQHFQTKPVIEKKKLLIKSDSKQAQNNHQFSLTGVYQMVGQASSRLSINQMTPSALLNYYTGNSAENMGSQSNINLPSALTSPDIKERTSKSESVQKNGNIHSEETQVLSEKQTPQRIAFKNDKVSTYMMAESATLAAVKYFQSNQGNPYDKTGRLKSTVSQGSENSGKSSARGINTVVHANATKGRNQMPNSKKIMAVNAASIVKPGSSLSGSIKPAMPGTVYMSLPRQCGTQGSSSSLYSNHSQKPLGVTQGVYTQSEASLLALAKKTTALMKKGPQSTGSSGKIKRKQEKDQLTASKGTSKLPVKQGQGLAKKVLTGTQGHTIFSVNAKFASNN